MRESQFQNYLVRVAKESGWLVHHTRTARSESGRYLTPIQGHKGFPDLVLVHRLHPIIVFAELKRQGGALKPDQRVWLALLSRCNRTEGIWVCLWKPKIMEDVVAYLTDTAGKAPPGLVHPQSGRFEGNWGVYTNGDND
jgi:hypothetical protein